MPFGLLGLVVGLAQQHIGLAVGLLGWAVVNSALLCLIVGWGVVRDGNARFRSWLYLLRDILGFAIWCASFCSSEIVWRDGLYALERAECVGVSSRCSRNGGGSKPASILGAGQ